MVGKDTVLQVFQSAGGKAFRIYEGVNPQKGRPWSIEYNDTFAESPEEQLKTALTCLLPGNYTLVYTSDTRKKKGKADEEEFNYYSGQKQLSFNVAGLPANIGAQQPQQSGLQIKEGYLYISESEIKRREDAAVANEKRFWDLEQKIANNNGGIGAEMVKALIPSIPDILIALTGKPASPQLMGAIAGVKNQQPMENGNGNEAAVLGNSPPPGGGAGGGGSKAKKKPAPQPPVETPEQLAAANESIRNSLNELQQFFPTCTALAEKLAVLSAKVKANPGLLNFL